MPKFSGEHECDMCNCAARSHLCDYHRHVERWRAEHDAAIAALNDVLKRVEAGDDFFTARGHVLARIFGDTPAGEVMPNAPDSRNRRSDVAVGEEAKPDTMAFYPGTEHTAPAGTDEAANCGDAASDPEAEPPRPSCTLHSQRGYCDAEAWFKGKGEGYSEAIDEFADDVARAVHAERARAVGIAQAVRDSRGCDCADIIIENLAEGGD